MTYRQIPPSEALTETQLQELYGDAATMIRAETELDRVVADLVQAPFDAQVQKSLAEYLGSEQLQRATDAAHRIGGMS
ncbi:hypothetical protein [Micrococcus luteus]|uniref:hypothetical protein n=1 Tax=Micrococcus luteus TaxID=1270 RepID=UPI002304C6F3|nr:hypothetical protein [Micrococcus luteus]